MHRLRDKVAFITGTAGGQGRAAALLFAKEGARVLGCDVKTDQSRETVRMVLEAGGEMSSVEPVDLSDPEQAEAWIREGLKIYGGIDILYNNASKPAFAPLPELSNEAWTETLRHELDLVFYATRAAWPHLIARGGGVIINTASIAGHVAISDNHSAHAAAKGGILAMTRQWASEGARHNIRAVSISPGPVLTPATELLVDTEQGRRSLAEQTLLKRMGTPEDIAYLALYLASDEASWMTGSDVVIDGGCTSV
jgi:meso-butanediol dehydrogenase/(S,S)-butanediol dehydrogenase/diacetyl reductase